MSDINIDEPSEGDTFPREYVEKLRAEAIKHRQAYAPFRDAFAGLNDSETAYLLKQVTGIAANPEEGAKVLLESAVNMLGEEAAYDALGISVMQEQEQEQVQEEEESQAMNLEDIRAMFREEQQKRAEAEEAARREAEEAEARESIFKEIEDAGFARGTTEFQTALALGKIEADAGRDVDFKALAPRVAAAAGLEPPKVQEAPAAPTAHPETVNAGGAGAGTEPPKKNWAEEAVANGQGWEAARARLEQRFSTTS